MCVNVEGGQPSKLAGGYFNDCPDEWCLPSAGNHLFPLLVSDSLPQGLSTLDSCTEHLVFFAKSDELIFGKKWFSVHF